MNHDKTTGWGAYTNKKKEIEKLKKQIIVQDINNYGEVISLDQKNNFKGISTDINPFRFPNKIKTEDIIELVINDNNKIIENFKEDLKEDLKEEEEAYDILEKTDISKEINSYKQKILKNTTIIENLINENKYNKQELDDKINELKKEYDNKLYSNNNKICKLQKYINTIEDMIKIKINLFEIETEFILDNDKDDIENTYKIENNENIDKIENEDKDEDEIVSNYCQIVRVPDNCSIINIMKNACSKQQETKINNFSLFSIAWDIIESSGYLYISNDLGVSWSKQISLGYKKWYSVASSSDGTKLIVANGNGYLYTSIDSGISWIERTSAGNQKWRYVASSSDGNKLIAAVANGYLYTSIDSGISWIKRTDTKYQKWTSLASSSDGTKLIASAWDNFLYTSTNSGVSWIKQISAGSRRWNSVASSADGTKLIASVNYGYIYISTDSGVSWTEQTTLGIKYWTSLASSSDGTKLVAGAYYFDGLYTSSDSGVTWIKQTSIELHGWSSVACSSDGTKIVVAARNNSIYISSDSGVSWTCRTPDQEKKWHAVVCSNF